MCTIALNPIVFQIVGLLLRMTKQKCFIDTSSYCVARLGLTSFGVVALTAL